MSFGLGHISQGAGYYEVYGRPNKVLTGASCLKAFALWIQLASCNKENEDSAGV